MRVRTTVSATAAALIILVGATAEADADAGVRQLPAPAGALQAAGIGMSASGLIHGVVLTDAGSQAVTWRRGERVDLEPAGVNSLVYEGNDLDQVVGHREVDGVRHAVLWSAGRRVDLTPPGAVDSAAVDVNNRGEVLVSSVDADDDRRLSLWRAGTWRTVAESPSAYFGSLGAGGDVTYTADGTAYLARPGRAPVAIGAGTPVDVNASGQVLVAAEGKLLLWSAGRTTDIGSLGGGQTHVPVSQEGSGPWLSDSGQVVGQSSTADGRSHAFSWQRGVMTDLTPDADSGAAFAVNRTGTVTVTEFAPVPKLSLWRRGTAEALPLPTGGNPFGSALHPFLPWTGGTIVSTTAPESAAYEWR